MYDWRKEERQLRDEQLGYMKTIDNLKFFNVLAWMCTIVWTLLSLIIHEMFPLVLIPGCVNLILHFVIKAIQTKVDELHDRRMSLARQHRI